MSTVVFNGISEQIDMNPVLKLADLLDSMSNQMVRLSKGNSCVFSQRMIECNGLENG